MMDAAVLNIKTSPKRSGRSPNVSVFYHQLSLFKANASCCIFSLNVKWLEIAGFESGQRCDDD